MARLVATLVISYELDEEDFPGGMNIADIRDEVGIWRRYAKQHIRDNMGIQAQAVVEDVTVENA